MNNMEKFMGKSKKANRIEEDNIIQINKKNVLDVLHVLLRVLKKLRWRY